MNNSAQLSRPSFASRRQRRTRGERLGRRDHATRQPEADRQGRLEHLRHRRLGYSHSDPSALLADGERDRAGTAGPRTTSTRYCAPNGPMRKLEERQNRAADAEPGLGFRADRVAGPILSPAAYRKNVQGSSACPRSSRSGMSRRPDARWAPSRPAHRATLVVMALVGVFVFLLLHLAPGDPAAIIAGDNATPAKIAAIRQQLGLTNRCPCSSAAGAGRCCTAISAYRSSPAGP